MELNQYLENMATNTNIIWIQDPYRSALELQNGVRSCLQDHLSGPIFRIQASWNRGTDGFGAWFSVSEALKHVFW